MTNQVTRIDTIFIYLFIFLQFYHFMVTLELKSPMGIVLDHFSRRLLSQMSPQNDKIEEKEKLSYEAWQIISYCNFL